MRISTPWTDVDTAIHWWLYENCTKNEKIAGQAQGVLSHFFRCVDSLYSVLRSQPLPTVPKMGGGIISDSGTNSVWFLFPLSLLDFFKLRGLLALIGDIVCVIRQVREISDDFDNDNLSKLLDSYWSKLEKYQDARNYFTHFDERIGKGINKHGVTGELSVPELGIEFGKEAKGCFYLGHAGDSIHYHDRQRREQKPSPKSISLRIEKMTDLFDLVRNLYDLLTSHSVHAGVMKYAPSSEVYEI